MELSGQLLQVFLHLELILLLFTKLQEILTGAYQGANNTKYPMYLTIIGMWLIRTGTVYLLAIVLEMGLAGVWIAIGIDIVFRAIVLWTRFNKDRWVSSTKDKVADCDPRTRNAQLSKSVNNY